MIQKEMPADPGVPEGEGRFFAERKSCPLLCHSEALLLRRPWSVASGPRGRTLDDGPRWRVVAGPGGIPASFDHAVFRTCEWIALERVISREARISNPVLVDARDLCERLHLKETPSSARAIDRALARLAGVEIHEGRNGLPRRLFSSLAAVRDEGGPTRALDVSYRLTFDPAYVRSVNGGQTLALNWRTWQALRGPAARRLMEILTCAFASSPHSGTASLEAREAARLIPLPPEAASRALRRILETAHRELLELKFISEARWSGSRPVVTYASGPSHRAVLDRLRPPRSASLLAWELASELTDVADAGAYQELVDRTDPRHLLSALSEIRVLRRQGLSIPDPRSFFLRRMHQSIERERRAQRVS